MRSAARLGFTIVELLVVIGIIGLLIALTLPAIEMARESGRTTQCKNNLRQLGIAATSHVAAHRHFPTGGWGRGWAGDPDRGYDSHQPGGWTFNLLAYSEEFALRELGKGQDDPEKRLAGQQRASTPIPLFNCPSRRAAKAYRVRPRRTYYNIDRPTSAGRSDYAANMGHRWCCESPGPKDFETGDARGWAAKGARASGLVFPGSMIRPAHILDGLSHTYLIGEKYLQTTQYETGLSLGDDQSWDVGFDRDINRTTQAAGKRVLRQDEERSSHSLGFGSAHPFGVQFLLADGSVQVVSYSADQTTLDRMASRNDGDRINSKK